MYLIYFCVFSGFNLYIKGKSKTLELFFNSNFFLINLLSHLCFSLSLKPKACYA